MMEFLRLPHDWIQAGALGLLAGVLTVAAWVIIRLGRSLEKNFDRVADRLVKAIDSIEEKFSVLEKHLSEQDVLTEHRHQEHLAIDKAQALELEQSIRRVMTRAMSKIIEEVRGRRSLPTVDSEDLPKEGG